MKTKKKFLILTVMFLLLLCLSAALMIMKSGNNKGERKTAGRTGTPGNLIKGRDLMIEETVKENRVPGKSGSATGKRTGIKTKEEIKQIYGRVEIVTLYNGQSYTGAVISIDDVYTMVTTEGMKKISMEDVKMRTILE